MDAESILRGFTTSLRLLTRLKPGGGEAQDTRIVLAAFPAVGLVAGVIMAGLAWLACRGLGAQAAAYLAAVALPPVYWWFTEGRSLKGVIGTAANWRPAEGADSAEEKRLRPYWVLLAVQILFFSRAALTGFIVLNCDSRVFWLALAPVLGLTAHAHLLAESSLPPDQRGRLPLHWLTAVVLVLIPALLMRAVVPALLALTVTWAVTGALNRHLVRRCDQPLPEYTHGAVREVVELLTLLAGLLYFSSEYAV